MIRKEYIIAAGILGCVLFFCGCVAPKELDENHFSLTGVKFSDSGILELNGEYTENFWGILELRGKVDGEKLVLSGMAEFWGDDVIQHRIAVPPVVSIVQFGKRVLWHRGENAGSPDVPGQMQEPSAKEERTSSSSGNEARAVLQNADTGIPDGKKKSAVTHLKIGGRAFNVFRPQWLDFETVFWGKSVTGNDSGAVIQQLGNDDSIYDFDGKTLNDFSNLEVLEIRGTTYIRHADLSGLSLPKLRVLVLDQIEVAGLESADLPALEEFYLNDVRTVPLGKISLPSRLEKLHTAGIQAYSGNFDFASLSGKPLTALLIISDCKNFDFLRGMMLKELQLYGFSAENDTLDVLGTLPLESLILKPFRPIGNWSFLNGLHLKKLSVKVTGSRSFSPSLLRHMPLEVLRINGLYADRSAEWMSCCDWPLQELILVNSRVPEAFLRSKPVENVALYQCYWSMDDPFALLNILPGVKHLAVWRMIRLRNNRQYGVMDRSLNWDQFVGRGVESLCISTSNLNFLRKFSGIKKVFIREIDTAPVMDSLQGREFEIFSLPQEYQQNIIRFNIKIAEPQRWDMLGAGW